MHRRVRGQGASDLDGDLDLAAAPQAVDAHAGLVAHDRAGRAGAEPGLEDLLGPWILDGGAAADRELPGRAGGARQAGAGTFTVMSWPPNRCWTWRA
jgi:hypothetical protein